MVGNVTIQGQIVGTATFDGAKISAVVTIAPPINATVVFGKSGVTAHNLLTDRDAEDAHPIAAITGLTEALATIPDPLGFTPENTANKKTTLTNSTTDYPSTSAVNRLSELKQSDSPEFANTQITTLDSVANGGIIPDVEATWFGATAKSVLSYLQKLVSKVYSINTRVAELEDNIISDITISQNIASVSITVDKNGVPLSFADKQFFKIQISGTTNVVGVIIYVSLNNIKTISYITDIAAVGFRNVVANTFSQAYSIDVRNNTIYCLSSSNRYNAGPTGIFQSNLAAQTIPGSIPLPVTRIDIDLASGLMLAGTRIIISKR